MGMNTIEIGRFFDKVVKLPSGCWIWVGALQGKYYKKENGGYGSFRHNGVVTPAHRVSYEHHKGEIPEGKEIDHLCRVTLCVNPNHLEAVTREVNRERGIGNKGEHSAAKTHCPHGHAYNEKNTVILKDYKKSGTFRACRKCLAATARSYYHKKKANNIGAVA